MATGETAPLDVFETFAVPRVINGCGIYTDLGGSILSPEIWRAAEQLNGSFVRMPDLLDSAGRMIAALTGAEAARVTPGASAAIALAVSATMTGECAEAWDRLPDTTGLPDEVVIARSHLADYKYAVCAKVGGARLVAAGPADRFDLESIRYAISDATACVLIPAHLLDGFAGTEQLARVVEAAHARGAPVVVDAAYMSFPTSLVSQYAAAGADLTCFSAKYYGGPNGGGFISGRADLVRAVAGLDFTCFESGERRPFGRVFKMNRYDVAATALALRDWMNLDHGKRWASYRAMAVAIRQRLPALAGLSSSLTLFTLSEEIIEADLVNSITLDFDATCGTTAAEIARCLEAQDPVIATVLAGDRLVIAVDALLDGQEMIIADDLAKALEASRRRAA